MANELATAPTLDGMVAIINQRRDLLTDVWALAEEEEEEEASDLMQRLSTWLHYAIVAAREHFNNRQLNTIRKLCNMERDEWQFRATIRRVN